MKYMLSCLLAFSTLTAFAQKWELGMNVGMLLDAHSNKYIRNESWNKNMLSPTISIKGAYNIRHWQFGAGVDYIRLDGGTLGDYVSYLMFTGYQHNFVTNELDYDKRLKAADPAIPVYVFVNRKLTTTRLSPYVGASLGYVTCYRPESPIPDTYKASVFHGIMWAVQAGANYKLSRHFGINAELRYTDMRFKNETNPYHRYSASFTTGLRYTF